MPARVLVVNGWSNGGKTFFCKWLAQHHGFDHVDCDKDGIDKSELRSCWNDAGTGDASGLKTELESRRRHTAIDWPYHPPSGFSFVAALQKAGVPVWHFDADPRAAQQSFDARGEGYPPDFSINSQANQVWSSEVQRLYGDRNVRVLAADGCRLSPEQIWAIIRKRERWEP